MTKNERENSATCLKLFVVRAQILSGELAQVKGRRYANRRSAKQDNGFGQQPPCKNYHVYTKQDNNDASNDKKYTTQINKRHSLSLKEHASSIIRRY
jgi:hypothetical protein